MSITPIVWDDIQIEAFLPSISREPLDTLAGVRESLRDLSQRLWLSYLDEINTCGAGWIIEPLGGSMAPPIGALVRLQHFFPGTSREFSGLEIIDHQQGGLTFGLLVDRELESCRTLVEDIVSEFGFLECELWDLMAEVGSTKSDSTPATGKPESPILVRLRALRLPGQFVVFGPPLEKPLIPGLEQARQLKARAPSELEKTVTESPANLASRLLDAVKEDNFELFCHLWSSEIGKPHLERRFASAKRSLASTKGNITFDSYDPTYCAENYELHGWVRIYLKRTFENGSVTTTPLIMVKEDDHWRVSKGSI